MMLRMSMRAENPEKIDTEPTARTTVTLPVSTTRLLKLQAQTKGRSVSSIMREALEAYLAGHELPRLPSFVGIGEGDGSNISERTEEIIAEMIDKGEIP